LIVFLLLAAFSFVPLTYAQDNPKDKIKIEKDVREMAGIQEDTAPVILDLESIRVMGEGKFQLDIVNIFNRKRPLIYKLEEGKYIIDLASTLQKDMREIKEIREPD